MGKRICHGNWGLRNQTLWTDFLPIGKKDLFFFPFSPSFFLVSSIETRGETSPVHYYGICGEVPDRYERTTCAISQTFLLLRSLLCFLIFFFHFHVIRVYGEGSGGGDAVASRRVLVCRVMSVSRHRFT